MDDRHLTDEQKRQLRAISHQRRAAEEEELRLVRARFRAENIRREPPPPLPPAPAPAERRPPPAERRERRRSRPRPVLPQQHTPQQRAAHNRRRDGVLTDEFTSSSDSEAEGAARAPAGFDPRVLTPEEAAPADHLVSVRPPLHLLTLAP